MNIVIVGQGAIGLLWYHHILQHIKGDVAYNKSQLHLLSSKHSLATNLRDSHQAVNNAEANDTIQQYCFTDHNNDTHNGNIYFAKAEDIEQADVIFFCVKSFQILSALIKIVDNLKNNSAIILAHNGMGILSELPTGIEKNHAIYTLLTTHGCLRSAPFCITHTGVGSSDIGLLLGENNSTQQQSLTQLLNAALPHVNYHKQIKQKQWLKLAINCVINPLTAINNVDNGQINHTAYQDSINILLKEIIAVASAEGVQFDLQELKKTVEDVAYATAKNCSSMRCDVLAKRRTEIDYINGFIHRLGTKHNIATPENTKMWQTVTNLEYKN